MNQIANAIQKLIIHINNHAKVAPETLEAEAKLREELTVLSHEELVDKLVALSIKKTVKVVQADLLADILTDPEIQILTYEEISENILANLETDQKYSVANIAWYKSNLAVRKGIQTLNRMPATERRAIDRELINLSSHELFLINNC